MTQQYLDQIKRDGFCVIPDVIPPHEIERIRSSVMDTVERGKAGYPSFPGVGFIPGAINYNQSVAPYITDSRVMEIVTELLGEHVRISDTSAIINYPGVKRGKWHADWPFNQGTAGHLKIPYPDFVIHLSAWWMLSTFDDINAGTLVIPQSHRRSSNPTFKECSVDPEAPIDGEVNITGEAGGVYMLDSRLWHARPANRSSQPRVAFAVSYAPWWLDLEILRPRSLKRTRMVDSAGKIENIVPPVKSKVFEKLPEDLKPLLEHWVETPQPPASGSK